MAILSQILMLFLLIVVGYIIKKLGLISDAFNKDISNLILNVTMPAFILSSMRFEFSVEILQDSALLIVISFAVYAVSIALSKLYSTVMHNQGGRRAVLEYVIIFSNTGFMGYPVVAQLFGERGVFYAAIYNLSFNILTWTYGVKLMNSPHERPALSLRAKLRHLINPSIVAIVLGYLMFLLNVTLPETIYQLVEMIGSTTTPLSMMFIGFILTEVKIFSASKDREVWLTSVIRLVVIPALTYSVLSLLGITGLTLFIPVVISAMPAAANTAVFASALGSDYRLGSVIIFITTLASIITIPILMWLIG